MVDEKSSPAESTTHTRQGNIPIGQQSIIKGDTGTSSDPIIVQPSGESRSGSAVPQSGPFTYSDMHAAYKSGEEKARTDERLKSVEKSIERIDEILSSLQKDV